MNQSEMIEELVAPKSAESPWTTAAIQRQLDAVRLEQKRLAWLLEHEEVLKSLPPADFFSDKLDFDNLPHEGVMRVILAFPGTWRKEVHSSGTTINYELDSSPFSIRCYSGAPPPNCKIVESEEEVPAIPASKRTVRKLVCKEEGKVAE